MPWECLNCGKFNNDALTDCEKCLLNKASAISVIDFPNKKTCCEECGHKHAEKVYCHVYRQVTPDDIEEAEVPEDGSEDGSDAGSDEISVGLAKTAAVEVVVDTGGVKPLPTPKCVSKIMYMRCNCLVGVPTNSRRFEPVPTKHMVGEIWVKYFEDAWDLYDNIHNEDHKNFHFGRMEEGSKAQIEERKAKQRACLAECLPLVCRFLPIGLVGPMAMASHTWNYGVSLYREYIDVRDCVPWQAVRSHDGPVDTILVVDRVVYSGGDRRVKVTDMEKGEVIAQVMRDSGDVRFILETDHELFCCSSNGSIRTYNLTHDHNDAMLNKTMWEHSRSVLNLMYDVPSTGLCELHGIENHRCFMYTISDDRTVKQWSTTRYAMTKNITCLEIRQYSFSCQTQSPRHLFVGTTSSCIMVFSKYNICERKDIHACSNPGAEKSYCLQVTLRLPRHNLADGNAPTVTATACCGPSYDPFGYLWAADMAGRLLIWRVPDDGLDFVPIRSWKPHTGAITGLVTTWRHVITCGDDGFVLLWDNTNLVRVRSIQIQEWCTLRGLMDRTDIPRRIKCIAVKEDHNLGGLLVVGTSYGEVVMMSIGVYV